MKLIMKICLAALLVGFLAVPALSHKNQSGGTKPPSENFQGLYAKRSEVKDSHDRYGIDGESSDKDHKGEVQIPQKEKGDHLPQVGVKGELAPSNSLLRGGGQGNRKGGRY
jgi:hypothetical protein